MSPETLIQSTLASLYKTAFDQFGVKTSELAVLLAGQEKLNQEGLKCQVKVRDVTFDDNDFSGSRHCALQFQGQQYDVHGNTGWEDIILAGMTDDENERGWTQVEEDDSAYLVPLEIEANPLIREQMAYFHSNTLDQATPQASARVMRKSL